MPFDRDCVGIMQSGDALLCGARLGRHMRDLDDVFIALARSAFRRRFRLNGEGPRLPRQNRGLAKVLEHARDFIERRLAPANPPRDGKQTPFRGHPVFVAQHATATCCRGCLEKWHGIARDHALDEGETASRRRNRALASRAGGLEATSGHWQHGGRRGDGKATDYRPIVPAKNRYGT